MADEAYLIKVNLKAMDYIWSQVPKEVKDGKEYVVYEKDDLPFLYYSGLVDTERVSLEEWKKTFEECLGEDNRYWVDYEKMISLGKYRYHKVVNDPFDPLKMRVGKYPLERLWAVFESSVIPSCSLPKAFLKNIFDSMIKGGKTAEETFSQEIKKAKEKAKEEGNDFEMPELDSAQVFLEGGKQYINVTRQHLLRIKEMLDTYPSPRRKLQVGVHELRAERLQKLADIAINREKSGFEGGKDFREETKKSLKDMLVKASENKNAGRQPTGESFNIADLQKSKRPPTKF
ncbi:MAG: hypothetical protein H7A32_02810 [Deltaproteobacteria bacterium]|nr:hypothetical protein [Deltaproteobacteria bacterium]